MKSLGDRTEPLASVAGITGLRLSGVAEFATEDTWAADVVKEFGKVLVAEPTLQGSGYYSTLPRARPSGCRRWGTEMKTYPAR